MRLARLQSALVATSLAICGVAASPVADDYTTYDDLVALLDDWSAAGATIRSVATSQEGRDIPLVSVGNGPADLLVLGRLHANEPSGTEASVQLVSLLLGDARPALERHGWANLHEETPILAPWLNPATRADLLERVTVHVLPMLDPDGVENGNTRDLMANTDYATRVTPTADAIVTAVGLTRPALMVDLHGGPNEPLNLGFVEPRGVDANVAALSHDAAATAWRAAAGAGAPVKFFEEHPFGGAFGLDGEPFDSADEAYYAVPARVLPMAWESMQLEGVPAVYSETVGLQSSDPEITIHEGASIQLVTLLGHLLDLAGAFDGTRPVAHTVLDAGVPGPVSPVGAGGFTLPLGDVPSGIAELRATVSWPWESMGQDWSIRLLDGDGEVVAEVTADGTEPMRRSRMLRVVDLPAGNYRLEADLFDTSPAVANAVLQYVLWVPDPSPLRPGSALGPAEDVALCLEGSSGWRQAAEPAGLAAESC